jgi:hypothetical protein
MPPFPNETLASYLHRLQRANGLAPERRGANLLIDADDDLATALSELTGRSVLVLEHALPELRPRPDSPPQAIQLPGRRERAHQRLACRHCILGRTAAAHVRIWAAHEDTVCLRHRRWLGDACGGDWDQLDLTACPDIARANRRHRNLIIRHGRPAVHDAYETARDICWKWFLQGRRFPSTAHRLGLLLGDRGCAFFESAPQAALYPNVVALTSILASSSWRTLALSNDQVDIGRFVRRVATEVTDGYHPRGGQDPLRFWLSARIAAPEPTSPGSPRPAVSPST